MSRTKDPKVTKLEATRATAEGLERARAQLEQREKNRHTRPDYEHYIVTQPGSERYERRMNRKMREMKSLDPEYDAERIRILREEVALLAAKVFKIVGRGVTGGADNTYDDIFCPAMDKYDTSYGTPFSWYFRGFCRMCG